MNDDKPTSTKKLGRFVMKDEDENESIGVGSLFAHRKDIFFHTASTVNTSNKYNTVYGSSQQEGTSTSLNKNVDTTTVEESRTRSANGSTKNEMSFARNDDISVKQRERTLNKTKKKQERQLKKPKLMGKPFKQLLEGVVLVISGYQNPHRGNLRTMALEMGARYKADWDNTCTHLICAFPNTPKFQQVWGKGHIIRKEWVENCHSKRKRLPWRRYALDKRDLSKPESEDEIPELIELVTSVSPEQNSDDYIQSESDTEDEIEKIRGSNCGDETDVDSDTDLPDTSNIPLPRLHNIFGGIKFYLSDELCQETKCKLHRYIIAFDGLLSECGEDEQVDIVISEGKVKSKHVVVRPEWIWKCNDAEKLLPTKMFEIC